MGDNNDYVLIIKGPDNIVQMKQNLKGIELKKVDIREKPYLIYEVNLDQYKKFSNEFKNIESETIRYSEIINMGYSLLPIIKNDTPKTKLGNKSVIPKLQSNELKITEAPSNAASSPPPLSSLPPVSQPVSPAAQPVVVAQATGLTPVSEKTVVASNEKKNFFVNLDPFKLTKNPLNKSGGMKKIGRGKFVRNTKSKF
jgi:hypothetical protein